MRNPKWHRDEIILALDLYFQLEPGQIHARNPEIIELSEILNKLPIHKVRPDSVKFRNPNGVGLKLSNFLAIDPDYSGKGMESFSKLDEEVFFEFSSNRKLLSAIASRIKATANNPSLALKLYQIGDDEDENNFIVKEGKVVYKLHKYIERNPKINKKKKDWYFNMYGKLDCEVCGFDYRVKYGELGEGFIECHHRVPLHLVDGETETSLKDLALVCANCHRMLHRDLETLSVEGLKNVMQKNK
jgi:5-methylcytosine-specific restriction protein A